MELPDTAKCSLHARRLAKRAELNIFAIGDKVQGKCYGALCGESMDDLKRPYR